MKSVAEKKEDMINCAVLCAENKLAPGTSGNISVRYGDKILITRTGSNFGGLEPEDIVLIDFDGKLLEGDFKPSSEKLLHSEIYKIREDINAIIHVHSPALSAFATANLALSEPYMAENVYYFGDIPLAPYGCPSTFALVEKTAPYFKNRNAVLMANHGFLIGDINIWEAYMKLEIAEAYAQTIINAKILGGAKPLTPEQVKEIEMLKN